MSFLLLLLKLCSSFSNLFLLLLSPLVFGRRDDVDDGEECDALKLSVQLHFPERNGNGREKKEKNETLRVIVVLLL